MPKKVSFFFLALFLFSLCFATCLCAQQTLGGSTGTVLDDSGSNVPAAAVMIVRDQTRLTRSQDTNENEKYDFVNLPIGSYSITVSHSRFRSLHIPTIQVQANRTATVNVTLNIDDVRQTRTVEETPLVNAVDTTNSYVLEKQQLHSIPLPTGSFTDLTTLMSCTTFSRSRR